MDVVTVAAAISATKLLVKGAKDISSIASSVDGLFHAKEQHEKNKNQNAGNSIGAKNKSILQKRAHDDGGEDTVSAAAAAVIEAKQLEQQMNDLKEEINRKWPSKPGEKKTWDLILEERKKRVAAKIERAKQEKIDAEERAEKRKNVLMQIGQGFIVLFVLAGVIGFMYWAATSGPAVK